MRASFVFHLETKVLGSGGRVETLIAQVAWSPVLSFQSLWLFGVQCHLLVLVHCVFWKPTSLWHRTAGSPIHPITAHQFTRIVITTTCKSFQQSAPSTLKHQHQLTSVSSLVQTPLDSLPASPHCYCVWVLYLPSVSPPACCPQSSSSPVHPPYPIQDSPQWFHPRSPGTVGQHRSELLITSRSLRIPFTHLLPAVAHRLSINTCVQLSLRLCGSIRNTLHPFTNRFWSTSCFLLLTSFLKMLISFSSRIWHLPTLPKAPKVG